MPSDPIHPVRVPASSFSDTDDRKIPHILSPITPHILSPIAMVSCPPPPPNKTLHPWDALLRGGDDLQDGGADDDEEKKTQRDRPHGVSGLRGGAVGLGHGAALLDVGVELLRLQRLLAGGRHGLDALGRSSKFGVFEFGEKTFEGAIVELGSRSRTCSAAVG